MIIRKADAKYLLDYEGRKGLAQDLDAAFSSEKSNWFTARLFRLMQFSDGTNLKKLERGFPREIQIFKEWMKDSRKFKRRYGLD